MLSGCLAQLNNRVLVLECFWQQIAGNGHEQYGSLYKKHVLTMKCLLSVHSLSDCAQANEF